MDSGFSILRVTKAAMSEVRKPEKVWRGAAQEAARVLRKRSTRYDEAFSRSRQRALRCREVDGEMGGQREPGVVTWIGADVAWLGKREKVALRMKPTPPEPNQSLEPTTTSVTPRAEPRVAPDAVVAHL